MARVTTVGFDADAKRGNMKHLSITLSGTPNTATTITIPQDAKGFGIYPAAAVVEYNVTGVPEVVTGVATNNQAAVASDEYNGNYAMPAQWSYRLLEGYNGVSNASRVLYVMSATASAVLYVEFF